MRANSDSMGHDAFDPKFAADLASFAASSSIPADDQPRLSLRQCLPAAKFFQCDDIQTARLVGDIDQVQPGDMVCFHTGKHDPVVFSAAALACGAAGILTEQILPCPLPQAIVGDVTDAACRVVNAIEGDPASSLLTIGVIGESGKTTTAILIAGLLKKIGIRTAFETDLGSGDGIVQATHDGTPASGIELIARLAEARDAGAGAMVVDLSGDSPGAGDAVRFDLLVIAGADSSLSASGQSMHYGPDPLAITLEQAKTDAVVVVPADHPKLLRRVDDFGLRRLTYSLRRPAEVSAKVFEELPGETTLMVSCGDETVMMQSGHAGEAMSMNALAAIAVGVLLDTSLSDAVAAISRLPSIPGRMQRLTGFDTASVLIDAGGSAGRLAASLRTARRQTRRGGKVWCVLTLDAAGEGCKDLHGDDHWMAIGRVAERFADRVILNATERSKPVFLKQCHGVLDGFKQVAAARLVADRQRAIGWAVRHAAPEDTILVVTDDGGLTAQQRRQTVCDIEAIVERARRAPGVRRETVPATIPFKVVSAK